MSTTRPAFMMSCTISIPTLRERPPTRTRRPEDLFAAAYQKIASGTNMAALAIEVAVAMRRSIGYMPALSESKKAPPGVSEMYLIPDPGNWVGMMVATSTTARPAKNRRQAILRRSAGAEAVHLVKSTDARAATSTKSETLSVLTYRTICHMFCPVRYLWVQVAQSGRVRPELHRRSGEGRRRDHAKVRRPCFGREGRLVPRRSGASGPACGRAVFPRSGHASGVRVGVRPRHSGRSSRRVWRGRGRCQARVLTLTGLDPVGGVQPWSVARMPTRVLQLMTWKCRCAPFAAPVAPDQPMIRPCGTQSPVL